MKLRTVLRSIPVLVFLFQMSVPAYSLAPPHDASANPPIGCADCHSGHGMLIARNAEQETQCKSCHNPLGQASEKIYVANHHSGDTVMADCGCCHDPHSPDDSFDVHTGISTENLDLIRANTSKYIPEALEPAVFHSRPGNFAFSDDQTPWNGICQTCHTTTEHHTSAGSGDHLHKIGMDCITCHPHKNGFQPIGECTDCHGQPPDGAVDPNRAGSHAAHVSLLRGPLLSSCFVCHAEISEATHLNGIVSFASGTDSNGNGNIELAETDICNTCHSPGGSYDGVNDPVIGAKANWMTGVYDTGGFQPGKEKWCAGCHDEDASVIRGVTAPDVIGDENRMNFYGKGYGFYVTGHGLSSCYTYPASQAPGAGLTCLACHDYSVTHIDGTAQTFNLTDDNYQEGYRLISIDGGPPMNVPRLTGGMAPEDFALCFQCHDPEPFLNDSDMNTNFRDDSETRNNHYVHLYSGFTTLWDSDWDGVNPDSRISCPACHNVHGSPSPRMMRHGELISVDREKIPSLDFQYLPKDTFPLLMDSTGGKDRFIEPGPGVPAQNGVCKMCHNNSEWYERTPDDQYPPEIRFVHGDIGGDTLTVRFSEAVFSQPDGSGALVESDFVFTDNDNNRSIILVNHNPGDQIAVLILDTPLDASDDLGIDTLGAATGSIFDASGTPADSDPYLVLDDASPLSMRIIYPKQAATGIPKDANLRFILQETDCSSGMDWTLFTVQITSPGGYDKTYTDSDTSIVSKTGNPVSYSIRINPDQYFPAWGSMTVSVTCADLAGNPFSDASWNFTTAYVPIARAPATIVDTLYFESAAALIDNDLSTGNDFGAGGPDHTVTFALSDDDTSYTISSVRLYGSALVTTTWTLYSSSDGIQFTEIGSWQVGGADQWYPYAIYPSVPSVKYLRINDRHGGPEGGKTVFEFNFTGAPE